jgi:hypothetical protein
MSNRWLFLQGYYQLAARAYKINTPYNHRSTIHIMAMCHIITGAGSIHHSASSGESEHFLAQRVSERRSTHSLTDFMLLSRWTLSCTVLWPRISKLAHVQFVAKRALRTEAASAVMHNAHVCILCESDACLNTRQPVVLTVCACSSCHGLVEALVSCQVSSCNFTDIGVACSCKQARYYSAC